MTRRSFTVIDIVEILVHWHAGQKKAEVARSLGVDRGTVAKYTAKAESGGLCARWRAGAGAALAELARRVGSPSWSTPASAASPTPPSRPTAPRSKRC